MYFAHYDQQSGDILGFYHKDIHGNNMPQPNMSITPEQHAEYFAQGQKYKVIGGKLVYVPDKKPTAKEVKALQLVMIREERNRRLKDCDWTQLPTARLTAAKRAEWDAYREQLFDLPATCDPTNPMWPVPPT